MQQYDLARVAIAEKARSERLFMNYALALAVLLALGGTALVILGVGNHLDIIVQGTGSLEARFVNASPGVAMWLIAAIVFWIAKPRRLQADVSHNNEGVGPSDILSSGRDNLGDAHEPTLAKIKAQIRGMVEQEVQVGAKALGRVTRMSEDKLHETTSALIDMLKNESRARPDLLRNAATQTNAERSGGSARVLYQRGEDYPPREKEDGDKE